MAANHDCLPILSCNAEEEDVGGTTERVKELPSAQKEMETNENEVSPFYNLIVQICDNSTLFS